MNNYFTKEEIEQLLTMDVLNRTKTIIDKVFEKRVDKAGEPYLNHLNTVAAYFKNEDEIVSYINNLKEYAV